MLRLLTDVVDILLLVCICPNRWPAAFCFDFFFKCIRKRDILGGLVGAWLELTSSLLFKILQGSHRSRSLRNTRGWSCSLMDHGLNSSSPKADRLRRCPQLAKSICLHCCQAYPVTWTERSPHSGLQRSMRRRAQHTSIVTNTPSAIPCAISPCKPKVHQMFGNHTQTLRGSPQEADSGCPLPAMLCHA